MVVKTNLMKHRESHQRKIQQQALSYIKIYGPVTNKRLSDLMTLPMQEIETRIKGLLYENLIEETGATTVPQWRAK